MVKRSREAADAEVVNQVLRAMAACHHVGDAGSAVLETVQASFDWEYGAVRLVDREGAGLVSIAEWGNAPEALMRLSRGTSLERGSGLAGQCWREEKWLRRSPNQPLSQPSAVDRMATETALLEGLCVPLIEEECVIGTIEFRARDMSGLSHSRLLALQSVAKLVSGRLAHLHQTDHRKRASERATRVMASVAAGDLRDRMDGDYNDEFKLLQKAVNGSIGNLRDMVDQIRTAAVCLAGSAERSKSGNRELDEHTCDQDRAIQNCVRSLDELKRTIHTTAETSKRAEALALSAHSLAEDGGTVAENARAAMGGIESTSEGISAIALVISKLAADSKLLSLNASIEAVRAGDAGRGFSVVANEIRAMAQRSRQASHDIAALVREGLSRAGEGAASVSQTANTLESIAAAVSQTSQLISVIAADNSHQAQSVDQVTRLIAELAVSTSRNAALVAQASDLGREIAAQSDDLKREVDAFKTKDTAQPAG